MTILILIATIAFLFVMIMIIDCNRFVIREYQCKTDKLPKNETMILLSDLHNKSFGRDNNKLLAAIEQIHPTRILIAGDMYTCKANSTTQTAQKLVCTLARKYPVYYCNGNHEQKTRLYPEVFGDVYDRYIDTIESSGVCFLDNEKIDLTEANIELYGLNIERNFYEKFKQEKMDLNYLKARLGMPNSSAFSILIAHNPDYFETYADWGADLVVSGHVHGGLMKLPVFGGVISPSLRLFPHYDGGEYQLKNSKLILSRGLGTHTLPIRIFNPGELVVIRCGKFDE